MNAKRSGAHSSSSSPSWRPATSCHSDPTVGSALAEARELSPASIATFHTTPDQVVMTACPCHEGVPGQPTRTERAPETTPSAAGRHVHSGTYERASPHPLLSRSRAAAIAVPGDTRGEGHTPGPHSPVSETRRSPRSVFRLVVGVLHRRRSVPSWRGPIRAAHISRDPRAQQARPRNPRRVPPPARQMPPQLPGPPRSPPGQL